MPWKMQMNCVGQPSIPVRSGLIRGKELFGSHIWGFQSMNYMLCWFGIWDEAAYHNKEHLEEQFLHLIAEVQIEQKEKRKGTQCPLQTLD